MIRAAIIATSLFLAGCNPVAHIAAQTNAIRHEAKAIADHGVLIRDAFITAKAQHIEELAADIHETLPDVEAKTPAWMSMIIYLAWAGLAIAVCVILWQTGLGRAIKVLVGWIPAPVEREARLLRDVMDPNRKEDLREFVAARRASSPLFDLAWRKTSEQPATKGDMTNDVPR